VFFNFCKSEKLLSLYFEDVSLNIAQKADIGKNTNNEMN